MDAFQIQFDTFQIDEGIEKSHSAKINDSEFIFYEPKDQSEISEKNFDFNGKYIAKIDCPQFKYIGFLTGDLKRINYGMNIYSNKDKYIGKWNEDTKHEIGVYHFNTETENEQQIYFGKWNRGQKNGKGIYLWKHLDKADIELSMNSYDAFFGDFDGDTFKNGISIKKSLNENQQYDYIIYNGGMTAEGKKEDSQAILIENRNCFFGQFSDDQMVKGTVVVFEKDESTNQEKEKTSYSFTKQQGLDKYDFNLKKENIEKESDKAKKAKAQCDKLDLFKIIEQFFKDYLELEKKATDIAYYSDPQLFSFFKNLTDFLQSDSNFSLI